MNGTFTKQDWENLLLAVCARPTPRAPLEQAAHYTLVGKLVEQTKKARGYANPDRCDPTRPEER